MKKFGIFFSIFSFLLIVAGCSNILPTYTVSGIVVDQYNQPLNDVVVSIERVGLTKTNYSGSFLFLNVQQGSYEIKINKTGYYEEKQKLVVNQNLTTLRFTLYEQTGEQTARASGTIRFGPVILSQSKPLLNKKILLRSQVSTKVSPMSLDNYNGILVQFNEFLSDSEIEAILTEIGAKNIESRDYSLYKFETSRDVDQVIDELRQIDGVEAVQPNHINYLMSIPNDKDYLDGYQWNLELINMPEAWNYAKGEDSDVIIAVLDTGIRSNSDLSGNIVAGYDVIVPDSDPYDDIMPAGHSHGTHMASIIGAVTNNGRGLAGVGWNLRVMPIKIFYDLDDGQNPITNDFFLAEGIRKAVEMGADIINISLGNSQSSHPVDHPAVESAFEYASSHGVAIFAAAGNDGLNQLSYPASSNYTFAVGATNHYGDRARYSNYGLGLDLVAPGGETGYAEIFDGIPGYSGVDIPDSFLELWEGTSSATAHVSAVAGLIHSLGFTNPETIYQILCDSAISKYDSTQYGAGLLNAGEALMLAANVNPADLSAAQVSAAKRISSNVWQQVTDNFAVNTNGDYSVANIPANESGIYIIAMIDIDGDGIIGLGDYFGYTLTSYTYQTGEHRPYVDFSISKITSPETLSALMNETNIEASTDQKIHILPMQE